MLGREIAGRYRITAQLGQGGMGAVYRAEQMSLKREVAIKLLKPELSAEPGLVRRFNAEAELAAKLEHPNTVTLFDFGQDFDGTLFIAMEFVKGISLREVIQKEGPLKPTRALAIAEQVTASLANAHSHGIIHRDLKPDNIMLSTIGRKSDIVRVLDFGIAKLRDERGDVTAMPLTQAGDLLGTPQYMAPEQIRGEKVDGRTDVYALGAMLYEMITGRLPFEANSLMAILSKHLTELPISPASKRPDLNIAPELDRLIMELLQKDPNARPSSMEELGERLVSLAEFLRTDSSPYAMYMQQPTNRAAAPGQPHLTGPMPGTPGTLSAPGPEIRRPTRPPGVPLTIPPDMGRAPVVQPTGTPAPGTGAPTPTPAGAHVPTPNPVQPNVVTPAPTPAPVHRAPAPGPAAPRRGSRTALWVILALVAAGGIAAGVVLAMRGGGGDEKSSGPPPAGERWTHPTYGYSLILPEGFSAATQVPDPSLMAFEGSFRDDPAYIVLSGEPMGGRVATDELLNMSADGIVASAGGVMVDKEFRTVQGERRMTGRFDIPLQGMSCEFVIYPHGDVAVIAMFSTLAEVFDATAALRHELFERRVILP